MKSDGISILHRSKKKEDSTNTLPPRRWYIAGFLSFLVVGLGQLYNSQIIKGLLYVLSFFILRTLLLITSILSAKHNFPIPSLVAAGTLIVAMFILLIASVLDALRQARLLSSPAATGWNRWYVYAVFLFVLLSAGYLTNRSFQTGVGQPFRISTDSMTPTLQAGDHVLNNRLFFTSKNPERGDVVFFKNPKSPDLTLVKRIVGLPGEIITIDNQKILINGIPLEENYLPVGSQTDARGTGRALIVRLKENQYFVLGDNRTNSMDSRSFGPIERSWIEGKPVFVFWSWNTNIPRWKWIQRWASLKIHRIGVRIR